MSQTDFSISLTTATALREDIMATATEEQATEEQAMAGEVRKVVARATGMISEFNTLLQAPNSWDPVSLKQRGAARPQS